MSPDILILKFGLPIFHRSYGHKTIENIDITGGFFQAILQFSKEEVGERLESIAMSDSLFYFRVKGDFAFILIEKRDVTTPKEEINQILESLIMRFFARYPNLANWDGGLLVFEDFSLDCDEILHKRPERKGYPLLVKFVIKPFLTPPVTQVVPVSPKNEKCIYELQVQVKNYSEKMGAREFRNLLRNPLVISLPGVKQIAYLFGLRQDIKGKDITHLLCFIIEEEDWFTFYQLSPLVYARGQQIASNLENFLTSIDSNPLSPEVQQAQPQFQEIVNNWADLNQYLGQLEASITEKVLQSKISEKTFTESQTRNSFSQFTLHFRANVDKVVFAILSLQQIVFLGTDKKSVEEALQSIITYYPHPSVVLWTEQQSDCLLVGTSLNQRNLYGKSTLIVDLVDHQVIGGSHNDFCSKLLQETENFGRNASVSSTIQFFQQKVKNVFTMLKGLLDVINLDKKVQEGRFQDILKGHEMAEIHLVAQISKNINHLLANDLQNYLSIASRFKDFFKEISV